MKVLWVNTEGDCGMIDEADLGDQLAAIENAELFVFRFEQDKGVYEQAFVDEEDSEEEEEGVETETQLVLSWGRV